MTTEHQISDSQDAPMEPYASADPERPSRSRAPIYVVMAVVLGSLAFAASGADRSSREEPEVASSPALKVEDVDEDPSSTMAPVEPTPTTATPSPTTTLAPAPAPTSSVPVFEEVVREVVENPVPQMAPEDIPPQVTLYELPLTVHVPGGYPEWPAPSEQEAPPILLTVACTSNVPGGHTMYPSYQETLTALDNHLFTFMGYGWDGITASCRFSPTPNITLVVNGSAYTGGWVTSTTKIAVIATISL